MTIDRQSDLIDFVSAHLVRLHVVPLETGSLIPGPKRGATLPVLISRLLLEDAIVTLSVASILYYIDYLTVGVLQSSKAVCTEFTQLIAQPAPLEISWQHPARPQAVVGCEANAGSVALLKTWSPVSSVRVDEFEAVE